MSVKQLNLITNLWYVSSYVRVGHHMVPFTMIISLGDIYVLILFSNDNKITISPKLIIFNLFFT